MGYKSLSLYINNNTLSYLFADNKGKSMHDEYKIGYEDAESEQYITTCINNISKLYKQYKPNKLIINIYLGDFKTTVIKKQLEQKKNASIILKNEFVRTFLKDKNESEYTIESEEVSNGVYVVASYENKVLIPFCNRLEKLNVRNYIIQTPLIGIYRELKHKFRTSSILYEDEYALIGIKNGELHYFSNEKYLVAGDIADSLGDYTKIDALEYKSNEVPFNNICNFGCIQIKNNKEDMRWT